MKRMCTLLFVVSLLASCTGEPAEEIDIVEVLPEEAATEIQNAYPAFKAVLVGASETGVPFQDKYLVVEGIEDAEVRDRIARYVVSYLEDPNKRAEEARQREAYEALPPAEKLASFVERMKEHYPEFSYEWTGLDGGNVDVTYGDNSLLISGVEEAGARNEIAHGLVRLQKDVDAGRTGEQE
ncbi:MAG: hypothetical protein ACE5G0_12880 [Rhodothermales bacterium]